MSEPIPKVLEGDLARLPPDAVKVSRAYVRSVAQAAGPDSASAAALRRASEYGGPVQFWYSPKEGTLTLEALRHDA